MKIIAEVEAGIMNDEWCFFKPTFSGLYCIYSVAPTRPAPKRPCAKTPAPNRSRKTGGAKRSRTCTCILGKKPSCAKLLAGGLYIANRRSATGKKLEIDYRHVGNLARPRNLIPNLSTQAGS